MERNRGYRRHHKNRMKARARRLYKNRMAAWPWDQQLVVPDKVAWFGDTISRCSCVLCGNPRRTFEQQTVQEQRADEALQQEFIAWDALSDEALRAVER